MRRTELLWRGQHLNLGKIFQIYFCCRIIVRHDSDEMGGVVYCGDERQDETLGDGKMQERKGTRAGHGKKCSR